MLDDTTLHALQESMSLTRLATVGLFQKIPTTEDLIEIKRDLHLHRCVLDKALVDMFSAIPEIRKDVEDWLSLENPDFSDACERAFLEPILVYQTFIEIKRILVGDKAKFNVFRKK
jgi:hypothetical protein